MTFPDKYKFPAAFAIYLVLQIYPGTPKAQWSTITHKSGPENDTDTTVAYTINQDGYALEIYIDSVSVIRSRFTLPDGLIAFPDKFCPTYQIDKGIPVNRSINDAPCISSKQWVEFVIGLADGNRIKSSSLLELMKGNSVTYRFKLSNNDYRDTSFSLQGSRRAMTSAFGENIVVTK